MRLHWPTNTLLCGAAALMLSVLFCIDIALGQGLDQSQEQNQGRSSGFANFFKRSDQRAAELLQEGRYDEAAAEFDSPQWRGVSRFRGGKYQQAMEDFAVATDATGCLLYTSPSPRDGLLSRMPSSA